MQEKNQSTNVHGQYQNVCPQRKTFGDFNTDNENIQSGHKDGIWHRKNSLSK